MEMEELSEILVKHKKWAYGEDGGKIANLSDAYLRGADLSSANLSGANLSGADLDYSCWPLWCGSLDVIADKRTAAQIAYHFCKLKCYDPEYLATRNAVLDFANQFHRVAECGTLEKYEKMEGVSCTAETSKEAK